MHRLLLLLFILGFGQSIYAASLFQFPDLTRRLPERTTSPGCAYKGDRYEHGERVATPEPCLNCTCIRAVLVCYLRVCPTSSAPPPGCFAAREVGECCPTLVCGGADLSRPANKPESDLELRPTFQPVQEETTVDDSSSSTEDNQTDTSAETYDIQVKTTPDTDSTSVDSSFSEEDTSSPTAQTTEFGTSDTTADVDSTPSGSTSTTSGSTLLSTLTDDDSLVYISSTQEPTNDYDMNFFNDIPGGHGCMVNGTLYGDGSAMLSSTFCEYCFCIRGKSTCLKPKCHLVIEGCTPHYDSHYSCCPSRYDCSQRTSSVPDSTTIELTSTIPTTLAETTAYSGDCIVDGKIYHQGDVVPDHLSCHNCYCSDSSVICEKIKCSPPLEGCQPIIPEGYCCPISYRCDYQSGNSGSNSIKGSNLNDSMLSTNSKGNDIKLTKNNFNSNNADIRLKGTTSDRESIALLHNVIPIHRRLDENTHLEENSTVKDIDEESSIQIGQGVSKKASNGESSEANITPVYTQENYKTLTMELNNTTATTPYLQDEKTNIENNIQMSTQTSGSHDGTSSTEAISVGSPEVHTLSLQELFEQFFSRHQINASKIPGEIPAEPKRNNSKQPSSIVEIYDTKTDSSAPVLISDETAKLDKTSESSQNTAVNTDAINLETDLFTSDDKEPTKVNGSVDDYATEPTSNIIYITTYHPSTSFDSHPTESRPVSSVLPSTNTMNIGEFQTHMNAESSLPVFLSTEKVGNQKFQEAFTTLPVFATADDSTNWHFLETSPSSQIFTSTRNFYNEKLPSHAETQYPAQTSTSNFQTEEFKQTDTEPTSHTYTSSINTYNEELKTHHESQPTLLVSDSTGNSYSDPPKSYTETKPTFVISDNTENVYTNEPKSRETQSTYVISDSTTNLYKDGQESQAETRSTFLINEGTSQKYSEEPTLHSDSQTTSLSYDSTQSPHSDEPKLHTEIPSTSSINSSPGNFFNELNKETESRSPLTKYTTIRYINEDDIEKLTSLPLFTTTEFGTETEQQETEFHEQSSFTPFLSVSSTIKNKNNEKFIKGKETSPASFTLSNTRDLNDDGNQTGTKSNFVSQTSTTHDSNNDVLNGDETQSTNFVLTSTNEKKTDGYLSTLSVSPAEMSTVKELVTTQTPKLSTRINSKLPSFNYIEKANDKNNTSFYSRFPVLTDSVVNVYLPAEGREADAEGKQDFTNVGSIYLGAPLSVGGTDSRKDIDDEKPKITQSGGVIFMDPKYTDIDTKIHVESQEKTTRWPVSTSAQKQTSTERSHEDTTNSEPKKGPRIQDSANQSSTGQAFKIIPFVAEDAIRGQFGKSNNTLLIQQGATEGLPDMVSDFCFIKGRIYMNGEMIGKPDPCELCRCFYGRELCQIQRCPAPPDCIPEKVPGFCCPRFTCGNNVSGGEQISREPKPTGFVQLPEPLTSTTRRPDVIERNPTANSADKPEVKFGIRVRVRPTQSIPAKAIEHTTDRRVEAVKTTAKPIAKLTTKTASEIRPVTRKTTVTTTTTTTKKPTIVRTNINQKPEVKRTTTTTTTTTHSPLFPDPWGLLKVSGCNIYGKFFNINDQVEILSGPCSHCICTTNGVECNDIC